MPDLKTVWCVIEGFGDEGQYLSSLRLFDSKGKAVAYMEGRKLSMRGIGYLEMDKKEIE